MGHSDKQYVTPNAWQALRTYTDARIGLGRAGVSLPTSELLDFQLAHAQAQDAVHQPLDVGALVEQINPLIYECGLDPCHSLQSRAPDRPTYLQRPDLGRRLDDASAEILRQYAFTNHRAYDLAIAVVDGLSSRAIAENTQPFLTELCSALKHDKDEWSLAPLSIVTQGRVAIGDEIGYLINARAVLVMVGERPGLSSPDSLGLYLTWDPHVGLKDARRNCISNVRKAGLDYPDAVRKLMYLLKESRRMQLSGVQLKERSEEPVIEGAQPQQNFLISNEKP
ncbi:ethanolamine ammonia-lyase subunit EutC [Marinobacterium lutimaris]|uniref:Ethanolamine ammonia-lyase small subunit n=1 Tax=Marinobacterium lutimaris TaxID=568106 RepID=A0A1H5UXS2_9GAMM|nr:ethanolamine ammonia-lyase subunit EutC [Marinobacterium lutimaris]SEF79813.1 Ethanolamine ammonia-lyase light chain [Marinobacterium lutimaris]